MPENYQSTENNTGETGFLMPPQSRYAGRTINVSSRRSLKILPGNNGNELIGPEDNSCVVDNLYHAGNFWRAVIPLDAVDCVYGQAFNFSKPRTRRGENGSEILFNQRGLPKRTIPMLNHVQSRFQMRPDQPIELYSLETEEFGDPVHRIHDIVYSFEAVGPVGVSFNLQDALRGHLVSAHRFLSIEEMVFERIVVEEEYVTESPPLPLDDREKRALLIGSLLRSHHAGMAERYYLFRLFGTNNCTSSPFQILDKIVKYSWIQRIGAMFYRLPFSPRFYLRVRGLDSDPSCRKLVRSEFEAYIADAATQQRKRDLSVKETVDR